MIIFETNFNEDMANYFARYFLAPIPYLIKKGITSTLDIMEHCGLSYEAARYASKNIENRMKKYGDQIFEYEKPLICHLLGEDYL